MSKLIPIIICEDIASERLNLENLINKILKNDAYQGKIVFSSESAKEILSFIYDNSIKNAIYILDIELKNGENGLELANLIKKYDRSSYIIFVTGHISYLKESFLFKTEALDFILKSNEKALGERLYKDIREILKNENSPTFSFIYKGKSYKLPVNQINYVSTSYFDHELVVHAIDKDYKIRGDLNHIKENFPDFLFIHRSILVNCSNICVINKEKKQILFKNSKKIKGSERKFKSFLESFHKIS